MPESNLTPNNQLTPIQSEPKVEYESNTFAENLPSTSKFVRESQIYSSIKMPESNLTPNNQLTPIQSEPKVEYESNTFAENLPSTSKLVSQPQIIINVKTLEESNDSVSIIPKTRQHSNTIINGPALERNEQYQSPDMMTTPENTDILPTPDIVNIPPSLDRIEQYQSPEKMTTTESIIPTPDIVNIPPIKKLKVMVKNSKLYTFLMEKPTSIWGFMALLTYVFGLWFDTFR